MHSVVLCNMYTSSNNVYIIEYHKIIQDIEFFSRVPKWAIIFPKIFANFLSGNACSLKYAFQKHDLQNSKLKHKTKIEN